MDDILKNLYDEIQCGPKQYAGHPFYKDRHTTLANKIKELKNDFDSQNDKLALLEAINISFRNGFTMPQWAHKEMSEAITNYFQAHGKVSLDDHLGIKRGRGRSADFFSKSEQKAFNLTIISMVVFLNRIIGFSLPISLEIIAERGAERGILPNEKQKLVHLATSTLTDIYEEADNHYKSKEKLRIDALLKNLHPYELFRDDFEEAFLEICKKNKALEILLNKEDLEKTIKQHKTLIAQFDNIQNRPTRWPGI